MEQFSSSIKTTIVCDEERKHVFEITKEITEGKGEEVFILTLYPTITEPVMNDLSMLHMINHCQEMGINKIHFIYLFSKVQGGKVSTKQLYVDDENMEYLKQLLGDNPNVKIVISFGSSMENSPVAIESKIKFFNILRELKPNGTLYQLDADGMEEECPHMLYAGIKYGSCEWRLRQYIIPYKYTPVGYKAYIDAKAEKRDRFIKNVVAAGKRAKGKKEADQTQNEEYETDNTKVDKTSAKKKGRKKDAENEKSN